MQINTKNLNKQLNFLVHNLVDVYFMVCLERLLDHS